MGTGQDLFVQRLSLRVLALLQVTGSLGGSNRNQEQEMEGGRPRADSSSSTSWCLSPETLLIQPVLAEGLKLFLPNSQCDWEPLAAE